MNNWDKYTVTPAQARRARIAYGALWTVAIGGGLLWIAAQIAPGVGGWFNLVAGVLGLIAIYVVGLRFVS